MLDAPWTQRAWCMQEQALSTPTVHFTEQFFYLECVCGHEMEVQNHGPLTRNLKPSHEYGRDKEMVDSNRMHRDWYSIAEQYTTREITYASDRVLAIAGLANRLSRVLPGDKYLSGLRIEVCQPGHTMDSRLSIPAKARSGGMPSWSWASYPAAVLYDAIDINKDDEGRLRPMCSAHVSSSEDKLVLLRKCFHFRDLFSIESVVPDKHEVNAGGSDPDTWKFWPDIRGEIVEMSEGVASAASTTAFEVSGLLRGKNRSNASPSDVSYCRKGNLKYLTR